VSLVLFCFIPHVDRLTDFDAKRQDNHELENVTCGSKGLSRGPGQKVVSFSLFGNPSKFKFQKKKYVKGVEYNLEGIQKFYPGWLMRVYLEDSFNSEALQWLIELENQSAILDLCFVENIHENLITNVTDIQPTLWRVFPSLDSQVSLKKYQLKLSGFKLNVFLNRLTFSCLAIWTASLPKENGQLYKNG